MNKVICRRSPLAKPLALVMGLLVTVAVSAQTSAPDKKGGALLANASKAAKPAKMIPPEFKLVLEARAMDLLKATCAKLAAAKSMLFTAIVSYEYPSKLGPPIVYTSRYDVAMRRPDKLKVVMPGDGPASEFYYDGTAMMAYAPAEDLVAVADAPPTIDAALDVAYQTAAIYYPFEDLIAADPCSMLTDDAILASYVGPSGIVGGTKTDMVIWASNEVFFQIWIGVDDKLPRRFRAVYRRDPLALSNEMELSNWQLDGALAADAFASQKAQSAKRITFQSPAGAPPPGVKPLVNAKAARAAPANAQ
jgi:hypothetical protein